MGNDLPPQDRFEIPPFRQDAYDEIEIVRETSLNEVIEKNKSDANIRHRTYKTITGLGLLLLITFSMLFLFVTAPEDSKKFDTASKLLMLVLGGILGFLFGAISKDDR